VPFAVQNVAHVILRKVVISQRAIWTWKLLIQNIEEWMCLDCSYRPPEMLVNRYMDFEDRIKSLSLLTVDDITKVLQIFPIHESHYLIFWALSEIACELTSNKILEIEMIPKGFLNKIWQFLISCLDTVLPYPHREKVIYYDLLAQIEISDGKINEAKKAYGLAYDMSCIVSGELTPTTLDIKDFFERTPTNVSEMRKRYDASRK